MYIYRERRGNTTGSTNNKSPKNGVVCKRTKNSLQQYKYHFMWNKLNMIHLLNLTLKGNKIF